MGHLSGKNEYLALQKRLDKMPIGAPPKKEIFQILEELFTPEECRIAAAMPLKLAGAFRIAQRAGTDEKRATEVLSTLVEKGLVVDVPRSDGKMFYFLNPTVIGFFEFTMMRVRQDIDQKKIAKLMWDYIREDPDQAFFKMISEGETFIARPLVHEDALAPEVYTEVLDYEKASAYIGSAGAWGEGICHCRHVKRHLGHPCSHSMESCLSLGKGAEYLIRAGLTKRIDKARALEVLAQSREGGLVQMGDNVKLQPTFICNCCKCCCEIMEGMRTLPQMTKVISSNYVAAIDEDLCNGCGKCAKACPINVIGLIPAGPSSKLPKRKRRSVVNAELCLGCGVCHRECKYEALTLNPIGTRVYTPETIMEKMMVQALEHGKLQHLLFDDPAKVTHRVLNTFLGAILNFSPAKQVLARKQVKSAFVGMMLDRLAKTGAGRAAKT